MSVVPTALVTALSQSNVRPFYAVEFMFDSAPIRLWTGVGDKTIEGDTYTGSGNLLAVGNVDVTTDLSAPSIDISLSGMPGEIVSLALQEPYQGRTCRIYFGCTTDDVGGYETHLVYVGTVNTMQIRDDADTGSISVKVDSQLLELQRSVNWRYTGENHKSRNPGDTFFDYVSAIQDLEIVWGRERT